MTATVVTVVPGPPWQRPMRGRLDELAVQSEALRANPLGDPHVRPLWVYLPPGHDGERRLPSIYLVQGMTGQVDMWRNRPAFGPTVLELVDACFADPATPPAIVVMVDCWTAYGGSQFLDSPGTGRYHTYLCDEIVPLVDTRYPTLAAAPHRGITGKSSGGYGAMVTPMLRPDLFGALASHAGDALFEVCYQQEFAMVARILRDRHEGSFEHFWEDFRARPGIHRDGDDQCVNQYAMAACYSTDDDGTVRLPFDTATGQVLPDVWERWLRWDPVRMIPEHAATLRGLRGIHLDAGRSDEYHLDLGAEAVRRALARVGVADVAFELFDGRHGGITWRYPLALRFLAERLTPT